MIYKGDWYQDGVPALHNTNVVETYGSPGGHSKNNPRLYTRSSRQLKNSISFSGVMRAYNGLPIEYKNAWNVWGMTRGPWVCRNAEWGAIPGQTFFLRCNMSAELILAPFMTDQPLQGFICGGWPYGMRMLAPAEVQVGWTMWGPPNQGGAFSGISVYQIYPPIVRTDQARWWCQLVHWEHPWPLVEYYAYPTSWKPTIHLEWITNDTDQIGFLFHHWNNDFAWWICYYWVPWE